MAFVAALVKPFHFMLAWLLSGGQMCYPRFDRGSGFLGSLVTWGHQPNTEKLSLFGNDEVCG